MTFDDDDDDVVVPSGSRRSSYVPPSKDSDYVPSMPPAEESAAPASSTGPIPSIGAASDEHVAQTPSFAESAEIPREPEPVLPPVIIEVPAEPESTASGRDQFGLPLVDESPIDIPQVVVSEPLPEALPGTGSVFDDNRLFPAVSTDNSFAGEIDEDPIVDDFAAAEPVEPRHEEPVNVESTTQPARLPELPARKSLTPEGLAEAMVANGGMSSNDQMALLDLQIPLREADAAAVAQYVEAVSASGDSTADTLIAAAADVFGDIAPELFVGLISDADEFTDDSTPITGVPVVEHIEVIEVEQDEQGDVVAVSVLDIETETMSHVAPQGSASDDQSWSLPAPADVVVDEAPTVQRRHWWTLVGYAAAVSSLIVAGFATVVANSTVAPFAWLVVGGVAVAIPFLEPARHFHVRVGATWRAGLEEVFGRVTGRIASAGFAALVALMLLVTITTTTAGLGAQLEASDTVGALLTGFIPTGTLGPILAALALFGGAVIAALPHRWYRAKVLVLMGWTALGTGVVAAMGTFLVLSTQAATTPNLEVLAKQFGLVAATALVLLPSSLDALHEITRVRESRTGGLWLYIGLSLGLLTTAGVVAGSLLAQGGTHFFFANNPALHITAPSGLLNELLGALAFVPAVLLISALGFRAINSATVTDDRQDPNVVVGWLLLLKPLALAAVAYLGFAPLVLSFVPQPSVLSVPVAATLGVLAARGVRGRTVSGRGAKGTLVGVALVATALGWGFSSGTGLTSSWVGYINNALRPYGYGLLYIDSLAPIATGVASFLIAFVVVAIATRRSRTNA